MKIKMLKRYQEQAVANGRYHMDYARQQYDALSPEAGVEQRQGIASHQGCLLLEAPAGSGKTLIAVSRSDAVEAGLVKEGVKCISFIPDPASEGLVDLEMTCLRCATGVQADLKEKLKEAGISLTPLLMVQVDSKKKKTSRQAPLCVETGGAAPVQCHGDSGRSGDAG